MKRSSLYDDELMDALKDPGEAAEYLNAALSDSNQEVFLLALRDVITARGGMTRLAGKTTLNRVSLYRMLSKQGNPELRTLNRMLAELGLSLAIKPQWSSESIHS